MFGEVDLTHASRAEESFQPILPKRACLERFLAQNVDPVRSIDGQTTGAQHPYRDFDHILDRSQPSSTPKSELQTKAMTIGVAANAPTTAAHRRHVLGMRVP